MLYKRWRKRILVNEVFSSRAGSGGEGGLWPGSANQIYNYRRLSRTVHSFHTFVSLTTGNTNQYLAEFSV